MDQTVPGLIAGLLRDRRGLLWVCQRHDLLPGEEPHDYSVSEADAVLRYRSDPWANDQIMSKSP
jgi:hypothetical protein